MTDLCFCTGILLSLLAHSSFFQFPQFCSTSARWLGSRGNLTAVAMVTSSLKMFVFCSFLSSSHLCFYFLNSDVAQPLWKDALSPSVVLMFPTESSAAHIWEPPRTSRLMDRTRGEPAEGNDVRYSLILYYREEKYNAMSFRKIFQSRKHLSL